MFNVELLQVKGVNKGLYVKGTCGVLPQPGRSFGVLSVDNDNKEVLQTTTVLSVDNFESGVLFDTNNSSYILRFLDGSE